MRFLMLVLLGLGVSSSAYAQYSTARFGPQQTAMGALGQTNVLGAPNGRSRVQQATYRTAARNGVAQIGRSAPASKPFAGVQSGPTLSPYLNLFREEPQNAAPNYHTFVRPQQQQYEATRAQQAELQQLQRQVQQATYRSAATNVAGGARFGDTGRFYNGWRR